ncbi:MAG TPA: MlaD family protein [Spirochaetota bacterium]
MQFKLQLKKNEIKVGIFILFPFIILVGLVLFKLGYSLSSTTYDLYLKVDNINAIKVGTPIKVKGYLIGRVIDIRPVYEPTLHFLALMCVSNEITLYESASAIIQNQNVIGDPVIEIRNPDRKEGRLQHGDVLEGVEYVNIEALLQDVHNLLATATSAIASFKDISVDSRGNIRKLVTDLASSAETVNAILLNSQKDVVDILGSFKKTAQTMDEMSKELKDHPMKFLMK